ncbi:hypothetical protein [Lamprocystis purpurea]|uniref:hypothetical protein n=1 Tax=Lamprocystis purpurea TaxID=61598 RepID=UPI0003A8EA2B|nr:hypothetical protein [Lamprocystis purpurea]
MTGLQPNGCRVPASPGGFPVRRGLRRALCRAVPALLLLGIQAALVAVGVSAAELPVAVPAVAVEDDLSTQVERLTEHIHGMEGKLKESAAARRTADQARMEAERRLAENLQEIARLNAQIGLLREAQAALEERLTHAQEQHSRAAEWRVVVDEQRCRLSREGEAQARRGDGLDLRSDPDPLTPGATLVIP